MYIIIVKFIVVFRFGEQQLTKCSFPMVSPGERIIHCLVIINSTIIHIGMLSIVSESLKIK